MSTIHAGFHDLSEDLSGMPAQILLIDEMQMSAVEAHEYLGLITIRNEPRGYRHAMKICKADIAESGLPQNAKKPKWLLQRDAHIRKVRI